MSKISSGRDCSIPMSPALAEFIIWGKTSPLFLGLIFCICISSSLFKPGELLSLVAIISVLSLDVGLKFILTG